MKSKPIKSPAFQFYVEDFVHGTRHFTTLEIGAYILLLCEQWDKGFIPDDPKMLKKITRLSLAKIKNVLQKFEKIDGVLVNTKLESVRSRKLAFIKKCRDSGVIGNQKRWGVDNEKQKPVIEKTEALTGNFFYMGTELFKVPVSEYLKNEFEIMLEAWQIKNKEYTIQQVFNEMDGKYIGYNFTNGNHIQNAFNATYKAMVKDKNFKNKFAPETSKTASVPQSFPQ